MARPRNVRNLSPETLKQVEGDWRAGLLTIKVIAAKYRLHPDQLRHFAIRCGWTRGDLGSAIDHEATRALIERTVSDADRAAGRDPAAVTSESETVRQYGQIVAGVIEGHRDAAGRGRLHAARLQQELQRCIGAIAEQSDLKERLALIRSSAETLRAVAVAMKTFIELERQAWQLDKEKGGSATSYDDFLAELHGEQRVATALPP